MLHTLLYSDMNQAVPGGVTTLSPGHEGGAGYGECQVPSPSQWSDPCYSPPSFHSPQHQAGELEKVKEEPFSPSASPASLPPLSPPSSNQALHHQLSPYARPQPHHQPKKEGFESSLNLTELLAENHSLTNQHLHQQHQQQPPSLLQYIPYPDHPLLRGCLEDNPAPYPKKPSPQGYKSISLSDGLGFLDTLVDVKQEVEDDVSLSSSCGSPAAPSSPPAPAQAAAPAQAPAPPTPTLVPQRDILETVEQLALEHARQDVQRVCDSLNIPRDPAHWTVGDVRAWLSLQANQLQLPPLMLNLWNLGGPGLLKLTEGQFRQLAPVGGELLYAQLEIWRGALRHSPKYFSTQWQLQQHEQYLAQPSPYLQQQQQQQVPQLEVLPQVGSPGQQQSPPCQAGSPPQLPSPASPPLSLNGSLGQVPTPVAQVSQQQGAVSPAPSPQSAQSQQTRGAVFMEEQCLDVAAFLHQPSPKTALPAHSPTDEVYDSEEEAEEEVCNSGGSGRSGTHIHLWQFLKELLQQPQLYGSCIRWLDRQKAVFKIEDSVRVARLWGKRKNRPAMNYDKLSRSIRQYYKKGIMKKTERSQRLVYQFCHPYSL